MNPAWLIVAILAVAFVLLCLFLFRVFGSISPYPGVPRSSTNFLWMFQTSIGLFVLAIIGSAILAVTHG